MSDEIFEQFRFTDGALKQCSQSFACHMQPKLAELAKLERHEQFYELQKLLAEYLKMYADGLARACQSFHDLAHDALGVSVKPITVEPGKLRPLE